MAEVLCPGSLKRQRIQLKTELRTGITSRLQKVMSETLPMLLLSVLYLINSLKSALFKMISSLALQTIPLNKCGVDSNALSTKN